MEPTLQAPARQPDDAGAGPDLQALAGQQGLAPLEIAAILRQLDYAVDDIAAALKSNYPDLAPLDCGTILLDKQVCFDTARPALITAMTNAGYSGEETDLAVNVLFPITMTVEATRAWQDAGLTVSATQQTTIAYQSGLWAALPGIGTTDAQGYAGFNAENGYALEGAPQGALVGRIGDDVFFIGNKATVPAGLSGQLYLCINDDLERRHGCGIDDNEGSIVVLVTTTP